MSPTAPGIEEAAVRLASRTDVGQVRSANEDSCDTFENEDGAQLLVVADGMGGHRGGATASSTAVATIGSVFAEATSGKPEEMLRRAIETANSRIHELAEGDSELEGMGTTVVAFLLSARGRGTVAHVGDSRCYRYRQGRLDPLTIDHSVVAEMHRRGLISADEAAVHPRRNEILRSVGVLSEVDVDVEDVEVAPGDRFLLCSDGLSGVVGDDEIAAVVQAETPDGAVDTLIRMANERGGPDNITVQILSIPADASEGDPEATAPVELSEVGIEAIESRRRARKQMRQVGLVVGVIAIALGAWLVWRLLQPNPSAPQTSTGSIARPAATAPGATEGAGANDDRFEIEAEPPRRGIPR